MKQLYALIDSDKFDLHQDKFPNAVKVGDCRLGVFIESDKQKYEDLEGLTILTYDQALELSNSHKEETPL